MNTGSTTADAGAARFSRRVGWTIGVKVLIAISSLLSGVIVARWLGPAGVGVIAALAVITALAINLGGLGLPSAITFLVARDPRGAKPIFFNAIIFGLSSGSITAVVIVVTATFRPGLLGDIPTHLLAIAAIALPFQMLFYFSLAIYLGLEKIRAYNLADLSLQAIIVVNAAVTLFLLGLDITQLVTFGTAANIIAAIVVVALLARSLRHAGGKWTADGGSMREMLRYGLRFLVAIIAGTVILRGDLLIVNYFRGSGEAGVYAVSTQAATLLQMMPAVVSMILFPRTASKQDSSGELTCRVTRHAAVIMFAVCLAAAPLSFLLPLFYGPAFAAVPAQFLIMLPGVYLLGIETIQVQHFTGLGLPRIVPVFWLGTMLISIALNIWLVPQFGAMAAAAVSSVSYAVIFVMVAGYFGKRTGRSFGEAFIIRKEEVREFLTLGKGLSVLQPSDPEANK
jgi:O-antigen/teichoic acid export membrane protein